MTLLAPALRGLVRKNDTTLADAYSGTALSQLRWVTLSAAGLAENYAGLPIRF